MSYDSNQDWQMQSPAWREQQIFNCLCTLKSNLASYFEGGAAPLIYRALISQESSSAPIAIVLENTLGEVPTFAYASPGVYTINTVSNVFTSDKTYLSCNGYISAVNGDTISLEKTNGNQVTIYTLHNGYQIDDLLRKTEITIYVYP